MTETKRDISFGRPWITDDDRKAVMSVLSGHILTHGPECKAFEAEFAGAMGDGAHAVSTSSCMAALHLAYLHFGVGPGDEVIVPAQTHTATVHAVEWVGARPVFVDCDPATGNLTADRIAAAITPRTRGLGIVHFVGIPCDMTAILKVAEANRLKLIEDCALAVGARWQGRHVGLFGDAGCFSFYPVKHITTGEGGMFVSRHREVAEAVGKLRAFGVDRVHSERTIPGMYDVPTLGLNYRMSEMQAALGRSQLRRLDENLKRRAENFAALREGLIGVPHVRVLDAQSRDARSGHYCLVALLAAPLGERRNEVVARLNAAGIGTSVYYPQPVPRLKYYREKYGYDAGRYPGAAEISDHGIALPVGWHVNLEDMKDTAQAVRAIVEEMKP